MSAKPTVLLASSFLVIRTELEFIAILRNTSTVALALVNFKTGVTEPIDGFRRTSE